MLRSPQCYHPSAELLGAHRHLEYSHVSWECQVPPPPAVFWSSRARGGASAPRAALRVAFGGRGLTRSLALALQVFFQVWPPGPSHEETPLSGSRGESCGLRGVKVEEPWAEGCVFQPKHAILHPTQLPPGPHFLEGLLRANKSCKNGIATAVRDVWGFLDSYTGI